MLITDQHRCSLSCDVESAYAVEPKRYTVVPKSCPHANRNWNALQECVVGMSSSNDDSVEGVLAVFLRRVGPDQDRLPVAAERLNRSVPKGVGCFVPIGNNRLGENDRLSR